MANIYVKKDGSGDSDTIQGGIQLAQVGDTVNIEAGTFDENLDLWKGVTLMGAGMVSGDQYQLHKIIIATPSRTLLVIKRSDISDASSFDFTLA